MAKSEKIRIAARELESLVRAMFEKLGMRAEEAATVARVLVWANLRGVDSHGVSRIPRYVELFESSEAKARPDISISRPRPATLLVDADGAPGPVAMSRAMQEAIATARTTGVAWAAVRGTVHTGAIGYYTSLAAEAGMIGIGMVAGMPNMAYTGAKGAAVATSPLSIGVPSKSRGHVVLDMATATIALGRIAQYRIAGKPLPEGAALTEAGEPTTDPKLAAIPTPMGSAKGAGMSLVFELITSVLAGNPIVTRFHAGTPEGRKHRQNGAVMAVDIAAFSSLAEFKALVDDTLATLKGLPRADGTDEILFPGERAERVFRERSSGGIPVSGTIWQKLVKDAEKLGVGIPEVAAA
ncbi:MAG TPA: Ldh family oxidoreductase [Steroidobacteraceae bacterium]|jgi:LDH2 family malate/lactate/ureidoglycolate dehydrogenase|nr:Ldh family oxidoreductase [Steroidobacteraceae bacterium]